MRNSSQHRIVCKIITPDEHLQHGQVKGGKFCGEIESGLLWRFLFR